MKLIDYFKKAKEEGWGIGQFNFSTIEQLRGILETAKNLNVPVILGTSEGESQFFGMEEAVALVKIFKEKYNVSAFLNLDHGKNLELIKKAIDLGYDAVHFDGFKLSLEENTAKAKEITKYARKKKVLVEGELGCIAGESILHEDKAIIEEKNLTNPEDVQKFIRETGVDSLAVSIGNIHGIYSSKPNLDFPRLKEIRKNTDAFLVLHGGSVIPDNEIKQAISLGITKINFNSEIRLVWKESLQKLLQENPNEIKPYKILDKVELAISRKVEEKIKLLKPNP